MKETESNANKLKYIAVLIHNVKFYLILWVGRISSVDFVNVRGVIDFKR